MKRKVSARILSILLSLAVVFSMMPSMAFADTEQTVNADVYVTYQTVKEGGGKQFEVRKKLYTVNSGIAESYDYDDSVDKTKEASVLDAIVTMLGDKYGEENVKKNLKVSSGWITLNGTGNWFFMVDGFCVSDGIEIDYGYTGATVTTSPIKNGQHLEFFETETYNDDYSWFEIEGKRREQVYIQKNTPLNVDVKYLSTWNLYNPLEKQNPIGISVGTITEKTDKINPVDTDATGKATITFSESGEYVLCSNKKISAEPDGPKHTDTCGHIIIKDEEDENILEKNVCVYQINRNYGFNESTACEECDCECCKTRLNELNTVGSNYSGKLVMSSLDVTVVDELTDEMKAANAAEALDWETISGDNDIFYNVKYNLNLVKEIDGAEVTWDSDNQSIIETYYGTVTPQYFNGDEEVTLTATVKVNDATVQKKFYLNVYEKEVAAVLTDDEQNEKINAVVEHFKDAENADALIKGWNYKDFVPAAVKAGAEFTTEQKNIIISRALSEANNTSSLGSMAKAIIVLTAMGIDATDVTIDGQETNLIEKLAAVDKSNLSYFEYTGPYILLAYGCHENYNKTDTAKADIDSVLGKLLEDQKDDGTWSDWSGPSDVASIIVGFEPYTDYSSANIKEGAVSAAVAKSRNYISTGVNASGDFGGANSNSYVIMCDSMFGLDARKRTHETRNPDVIDALFKDYIAEGVDANWFKYGKYKNEMATVDAYRALVSYGQYKANAKDIYDYSGTTLKHISVEALDKELSALFVTEPEKTAYTVGDTADYSGMVVKVKFEDGTTRELSSDEYTVTGFDTATEGTKTVTVSYTKNVNNYNQTVNANFVIQVTASGSTAVEQKTAATTVTNSSGTVIANEATVIQADVTTVLDVLKQVLAKNGLTATIKNGTYVASIDNESEFDKGGNSGWMVRVNGVLINVSAAEYKLKGGERIEWFYTKDWTTVPGVTMPEEPKPEVNTGTAEGTVTTTVPAEVTLKDNVATATVTDDTAKEAVKQAKENKADEVVLQIKDTKDAKEVNIQVKTDLIKDISSTDAKLTIETDKGSVTVDDKTIEQISKEASGTEVTIVIRENKEAAAENKAELGDDAAVFTLEIRSGNTNISVFNGKVTVTLPIPQNLIDKAVGAVHVGKDGKLEKLEGKKINRNKVDFYEFVTAHFSEFALVDMDKVSVEEPVDVKALVKEIKVSPKSSKTSKGNIKITAKADVKAITDLGYTVKYKFYRSTKKTLGTYKAMTVKDSNTYVNTTGKKGRTYYYRVKVLVYDENGLVASTELKQSKYASRKK